MYLLERQINVAIKLLDKPWN